MPSRTVHAMGNDSVFLRAVTGLTYNSNVLGVADDAPSSTAGNALGGRSKDSWIWDYGLGLRLDIPVSRQRFRLDGSAVRRSYEQFSDLDYTGYDLRGVWNWNLGSRWRGNLGASASRSRQNFLGGTSVSFPALVKNYETYLDAAYALTPRWELGGSVGAARLRYDGAPFALDDFNSTTQSLSAIYRTPAGNATGLRLTFEHGEWPNRRNDDTSRDNSYRQQTLAGVIDWAPTGRSQLSGQLGYTRRDGGSGDGAGGPSVQLTYRYALTGKSQVRASVFNLFGPLDDANASYVRTTGIEMGYRYSATEKITVNAIGSIKTAKYLGGPTFSSSDGRSDDFYTLTLAADYRIARALTLSVGTQYDKRTSNIPNSTFDVYTLFLRAVVEF